MAEQLKEFANVTLTQANFSASDEYTVVTNNSTTQAVVKDISANITATGLDNTNVNIISGVATIGKGGKSTGFELIPQSGTLKLKVINALPTGKVQDYLLYTLGSSRTYHRAHALKVVETTFFPLIAGSSYAGSFTDNTTNISSVDNGGNSPQNDIVFYWQNDNFRYYYNYNGNNVTNFFKVSLNSAGAATSTWGSVNGSSYKSKAIDTVNDLYFWQHDASNVIVGKLSTATHEEVTVTGWTGAVNPTSYNMSSACNNIFFVKPSRASTTEIFYYNHLTGGSGKITGSYIQEGIMSVTYNAAEQRYYIITKENNATTNKMLYLNGNSLSGNHTATLVNSGNSVMGIISGARYIGSNSSGQFAYTSSGNRAQIGLATTSGITVQNTGTNYQYEDQAGGTFAKQATSEEIPANQADLSYSIALKMSGVEITGV